MLEHRHTRIQSHMHAQKDWDTSEIAQQYWGIFGETHTCVLARTHIHKAIGTHEGTQIHSHACAHMHNGIDGYKGTHAHIYIHVHCIAFQCNTSCIEVYVFV